MAKSLERTHLNAARLALLLLVVIPFIPEVIVFTKLQTGTVSSNDFVDGFRRWQTEISLITGAWLVACYVAVAQGWSRLLSRLLLGFAVTLAAILTYGGPGLAISFIKNAGGNVSGEATTAAVKLIDADFSLFGVLPVIGLFAAYAIVVIVAGAVSARQPGEAE